MPMTDIAALLLGLVIAPVVAAVAGEVTRSTDDSMRWEGGFALGLSALVVLGPLWIAQAACTVLSTVDGAGVSPWWLWVWLFLAPALGASPPAVALLRRLKMLRTKGSHPDDRLPRVRFLTDQAWAATAADPAWELRRTPPLPQSWPPVPGDPLSWFCYAERANTPSTIEVAAPWGRVDMADTSREPLVHRLTDEVELLGLQGIQPLSPEALRSKGPSQLALVDAVRRGDPDGTLAGALQQWRALNGLIAAHPAVATRLPPPAG
jgi:hypothetical protein